MKTPKNPPSERTSRPSSESRPSLASNRAVELSKRDHEAIRAFVASDAFYYLQREALRRRRVSSPSHDLPHQAQINAGYIEGFNAAFDVIADIAKIPTQNKPEQQITYSDE